MIALALAAAAPHYLDRYSCDLLAPSQVMANQAILRAQLDVETNADRLFLTLTTEGTEEWSAKRQEAKTIYERNGEVLYWPRALKLRSGLEVEIELKGTAATEGDGTAALLVASGGDHVVAGLAENDRSYVAIGLCRENPQDIQP